MAVPGKSGAVFIGGVEVAGMNKWNIKATLSTGDTTDFSSDGVASFTGLISSWAGSFSGNKITTPQALTTTGVVAAIFKETDTAGQNFTGNILITGYTVDTSFDGLVTYSYDFQGTGTLTPASA